MKKYYISALSLSAAGLFMIGCGVRIPSEKTPKPSYYGIIDQISTVDGFPAKPEPWAVVSDRDNNTVFMDKGDEKSPKEIKFMEPLLVVKRNLSKGMVKVAQYNPDALLRKLPAKSLKVYGWIPEDQLLLWTNSVKNQANGFAIKAALVPNHSDVLKEGQKYLQNDSVMVFTSPDLTKTAKVKLPVGQMVYIYKHAENNRRYLIGKSPSVKIDSIAGNMYGWVSSNMLAVWGDRTGIRVSDEYTLNEESNYGLSKQVTDGVTTNAYFNIAEAAERSPVENLIGTAPVEISRANQARFFSNAFDYSKNFVYNVLGEPLYYNRYKEITAHNKNLNIVFVMDISRDNNQSTAVAKSAFQELQQKVKKIGYFKNIRFGAVVYKNNPCTENVAASQLGSDLVKIAQFIDQQAAQVECSTSGGQPMQAGLAAAGDLLIPYKDDSNIVVLVGATAESGGYADDAVTKLSEARARIISYQTAAGASDNYNNFVLLSENIVTATAKNISELEKERITDQSAILNRNNYSLQQESDGVFALDYPASSMVQGYVMYPKKGEINSNAHLAQSLDSLVVKFADQNMKADSALVKLFQSPIGLSKTELRSDFRPEFPTASAIIPVETASELVLYSNPFLTKGRYSDDYRAYQPIVQRGILISEKEYDRLKDLYLEIFKETKPYSNEFSQNAAVSAYLKVLRKYNPSPAKFRKGDFSDKSMAYSTALSTGFDNAGEELLSKYTLAAWKNGKQVPAGAAKDYFRQFKILADRLLENKTNKKIIIEQNGERFYWLNGYFMPQEHLQESL